MILELALAVAAVAFEHADKPIKNNTGATTVVLSEKATYIVDNNVKNYFVVAINDARPGMHVLFSLNETECKEGKGGLVLARETGPDTLELLDMHNWTDKDDNPAGEIGRAVCEVAAKGNVVEWHPKDSQKQSVPNYTEPNTAQHQYEHPL